MVSGRKGAMSDFRSAVAELRVSEGKGAMCDVISAMAEFTVGRI